MPSKEEMKAALAAAKRKKGVANRVDEPVTKIYKFAVASASDLSGAIASRLQKHFFRMLEEGEDDLVIWKAATGEQTLNESGVYLAVKAVTNSAFSDELAAHYASRITIEQTRKEYAKRLAEMLLRTSTLHRFAYRTKSLSGKESVAEMRYSKGNEIDAEFLADCIHRGRLIAERFSS